MGGGRHFHFPKHVWSPSGGWWANPTHWKRNTGFAFVGIGLAFIAIARVSSDREVRERERQRDGLCCRTLPEAGVKSVQHGMQHSCTLWICDRKVCGKFNFVLRSIPSSSASTVVCINFASTVVCRSLGHRGGTSPPVFFCCRRLLTWMTRISSDSCPEGESVHMFCMGAADVGPCSSTRCTV